METLYQDVKWGQQQTKDISKRGKICRQTHITYCGCCFFWRDLNINNTVTSLKVTVLGYVYTVQNQKCSSVFKCLVLSILLSKPLRKAANLQIWDAGNNECLTFFLDEWFKQLIDCQNNISLSGHSDWEEPSVIQCKVLHCRWHV